MLRIVSTDFAKLKSDADRFDAGIIRGLRREIKALGNESVSRVQKTLRMPAPSSGDGSVGSREGAAKGTRVMLSFSKRSAGAKIVSSNARVPAGHKGFVGAYNERSFRHPVFGHRDRFVTQEGRPYFGSVISEVLDKEAVDRMVAAIDTAVRAAGGRGK